MSIFSEGRTLPAPSRADRSIPVASKGHCTAYTVFGDGVGVRFQAESYLELCHLNLLHARRDIADLREQVRFDYGYRNEQKHFFDAVAALKSGARIACTVKPQEKLRSGHFIEEMRQVAYWVQRKDFADSVRLLTDADIDRAALHNAELLNSIRDADPEAESVAIAMAQQIRGSVSIRDLTQEIGLGVRGYRALLRLIRVGILTQSRPGPITPATLVQWKGTIQ